jgi:endonuclease/exonuclease/phosphatase family metal-dependent hydrolase
MRMGGTEPNTFKIAQLNAENLFLFLDDAQGRDWRKLPEKEWQKLSHASVPNKSLLKTLWLADTLRAIDADIVFMCEVGGEESLRNFSNLFLEGAYTPHLMEGNSDRGIDIGYLVKKNFKHRVELRSYKNRPLKFQYPHEISPDPERPAPARTHYFSRDCAELRIYKEGAAAPALICLSVHLKSKLDPEGIDPEGLDRRAAEVVALTEIYKEIRQEFSPPVPVLIAGDFNGCAKRGQLAPEFKPLAETELESLMDVLGRDDEAAATQLQFNRGGGITWLQIDYIFMTPELKQKLIPEGCEVFRYRSELNVALPLPKTLEQRLAMPSDHYPVVATFQDIFT